MPAHKRVGRDDGGQALQGFVSDGLGLDGEDPPLIVVKPQAFLALDGEQGFDLSALQVDDLLLLPVQDGGEDDEQ